MARKQKNRGYSHQSSSLEPVEHLSLRLQRKLLKRVDKQQKRFRSSGKPYPLIIVQGPSGGMERESQRRLKRLLHGSWFGYPLYQVLTVISVIAWVLAAVFGVTWLIAHPPWAANAVYITVIVGIIGVLCAIWTSRTKRSNSYGDKTALLVEHVEENILYRVTAAGRPLVLLRRGSEFYAISATCPHAGGPLDEGKLEGDVVECPWHGSRFCMRDGRALTGPATVNVPCYEVFVRNGQVLVKPVGEH